MRKLLLSAVAVGALVAFGGAAWADVLFGVAGPITGPNAAFGAQLQKGAEAAVADINAKGGINGEQIKLEVGDDVSDPKQGISVANKFVGDGVKFVVGHFNSGVSIPSSEVYAENGIVADHAGLHQPAATPSVACGTRSAPADATTSRVALPALISPRTSRMPRSPSCTTRPPMVRASPTKPRRQ